MIDFNYERAVEIDGSFFSVKIEKGKNDNQILLINGKHIHSQFTPEKEGEKLIYPGKNLICIFGLGLGYHINNIIKNNPASIFIIYEPFFDLITGYDKKNKNILFLNNINDEKIFNFLEINNFFSEGRIYSYSNLGYKNIFPEKEILFFRSVKKAFEITIQNILTESNFTPLWIKNFLYNSSLFYKSGFLNLTKKNLDFNLAVIACAGPGLINDIPCLISFREKITIFCVDTAIKTLLKNNIYPDFIISLDGQVHSFDDFIKYYSKDTALIFDVFGYNPACRLSNNFYFTITENIYANSIIEYFMKKMNISIKCFPTGGTVSDYALALCVEIGFKKIYFSGLDLSYPHLVTHCNDSPSYERFINSSSYFESIETKIIKILSKRNLKLSKSRINKENIFTDFILENYAFYFEKFKETNNELNLYYSNKSGLLIKDFIKTDLKKLIESEASKRIRSCEFLSKDELKIPDKKEICNFLESLKSDLYNYSLKFKDLYEFSNFDNSDMVFLNNWKNILTEFYNEFPFIKKFVTMTEMILQKKNITEENSIYYKHTGFKIIQSLYYLIRVIQKTQKMM